MTFRTTTRTVTLTLPLVLMASAVSMSTAAAAPAVSDLDASLARITNSSQNRAAPSAEGDIGRYSSLHGMSVQLPASNRDEMLITTKKTNLAISLPHGRQPANRQASKAGVEFFDNGDGSRVAPLVKSDGSIEIATILENREAPSVLTYGFSSTLGVTLTKSDVAVLVTTKANKWLTALVPLAAVDAEGRSVATHLEIQGESAIQVIDDDEDTDITYPVTVAASAAVQLISKVSQTGLDHGQARYSVYRTAAGKNLAGTSAITILQTYGWPQAVNIAPNGFNTTSVHQQFDCHAAFARAKDPWNLERWRPENPNWPINPQLCNWS